jgi:hypothetical protein
MVVALSEAEDAMENERWRQIEDLYHAALERAPDAGA